MGTTASIAILAVVGNIDIDRTLKNLLNIIILAIFLIILCSIFQCPEEPEKKNRIFLEVERNVPVSQLLFWASLMTNRLHKDYYVYDMISVFAGKW